MIKVDGAVEFKASARRAQNAMMNEHQLAHFLPHGSVIKMLDDGTFEFTVTKDIGITVLTLNGTMSVTPVPNSDQVRFKAGAKHMVGGAATFDFLIRFSGDEQTCNLIYEGDVGASGLVGNFLSMGESKVQGRFEQLFTDFGARMARSQKVADDKRTAPSA